MPEGVQQGWTLLNSSKTTLDADVKVVRRSLVRWPRESLHNYVSPTACCQQHTAVTHCAQCIIHSTQHTTHNTAHRPQYSTPATVQHTSPTAFCSQHVTHSIVCHPQIVTHTHSTSPTVCRPQYVAHSKSPTVHRPQHITHSTLPIVGDVKHWNSHHLRHLKAGSPMESLMFCLTRLNNLGGKVMMFVHKYQFYYILFETMHVKTTHTQLSLDCGQQLCLTMCSCLFQRLTMVSMSNAVTQWMPSLDLILQAWQLCLTHEYLVANIQCSYM